MVSQMLFVYIYYTTSTELHALSALLLFYTALNVQLRPLTAALAAIVSAVL
jgi:hypothetical protein